MLTKQPYASSSLREIGSQGQAIDEERLDIENEATKGFQDST